jgi:hypothetical protein
MEIETMEKLHEAIQAWYLASAAYDEAFAGYDGYSWGWAGQEQIEARQEAAENLETVLNTVIDKRVREAIAEFT